jgi:hypothetical protein
VLKTGEAYIYAGNNPIMYNDPTGNIRRSAINTNIVFAPIRKYGYSNNEVVFSGDGEFTAWQVRGTIGRVYANDGKTFLTVLKVESWYNQDGESKDWAWESISKTDCRRITNCLGTSVLSNSYLPLNPGEVHKFLLADGYKFHKTAKDMKFQPGDIISFYDGAHFIRAINKDKNGDLLWESRMAGDTRKVGTLSEIFSYNSDTFEDYNNLDNASLYRPAQGDVYVDGSGNIVRQDEKKLIYINKICADD